MGSNSYSFKANSTHLAISKNPILPIKNKSKEILKKIKKLNGKKNTYKSKTST